MDLRRKIRKKSITSHFEHKTRLVFCLDSTGINWKLWTIFQSWLCFHIIVLLHETILPRKTTSCSRRFFWKLRIALMSPGRTEHVCNLKWTSILSKQKSLKSREHEVVNIVSCNNTIMWKHNQFCNIVQSFQSMPAESKQND